MVVICSGYDGSVLVVIMMKMVVVMMVRMVMMVKKMRMRKLDKDDGWRMMSIDEDFENEL